MGFLYLKGLGTVQGNNDSALTSTCEYCDKMYGLKFKSSVTGKTTAKSKNLCVYHFNLSESEKHNTQVKKKKNQIRSDCKQ